MSNMKIETQIDRLGGLNKMQLLRYLIKHNNLSENRKKSIAIIKAFDNPSTSLLDETHRQYTGDVSLYFALLKRKHKITEEELK